MLIGLEARDRTGWDCLGAGLAELGVLGVGSGRNTDMLLLSVAPMPAFLEAGRAAFLDHADRAGADRGAERDRRHVAIGIVHPSAHRRIE